MEAILTRDSGAQKCKFFFNAGAKFGAGVFLSRFSLFGILFTPPMNAAVFNVNI